MTEAKENCSLAHPLKVAMGGCFAMAGALGIGRFIYTPILPFMAESLHLTKAEAGIIASANFVGYLIGALVASMRLPGEERVWMMGALLVSAITTAAMSVVGGVLSFLAMRALGGAASAVVLVCSSALVLQYLSGAARNGLVAVHFGGVGLGIAASAASTWAALRLGGDWRSMWLSGAVLTLGAAILAVWLIPSSRPAGPSTMAATGQQVLFKSWPLIAAYGLFGFGYVITATFIVSMVRGLADAANVEPLVWLVVGVFAAPSVAVWSSTSRRTGVLNAFAAACLVEAAGVSLSAFSSTATGLLVSAALLGGTFMGITALGMVAARNTAVGPPQRFLGVMTAAFGVGQIIGPSAAGFGFELTGSFYLPSLTASAALCLAALLTILLARRDKA